MTLINQDQIEGEFPILKLGVGSFASIGILRFASTGSIWIRNEADDGDLVAFAKAGQPGTEELHFGDAFVSQNSPSSGRSALVKGTDDETGGSVTLLGGNGEIQGGTIAAYAGNASDDSTPGGSLEFQVGAGKGAPVGSILFLTAAPAAGTGDTQTHNTRGTMADEVFTWDGVFKLTPRAFADLPAAPSEGMMAWVNDSSTATWGATIAGGGANKVLAVYGGTNWTVAAKA